MSTLVLQSVFLHPLILMGPQGINVYHSGRVCHVMATPILYIYSLGHFLTTKGALIDGDAYPPKNDQK